MEDTGGNTLKEQQRHLGCLPGARVQTVDCSPITFANKTNARLTSQITRPAPWPPYKSFLYACSGLCVVS